MRGLPIVNPNLAVDATSPRILGEHLVCVLISPWFMNLVLLPGTREWDDDEQGTTVDIAFPHESLEFTICRDSAIGTYLSAVLFRTVIDFPGMETALHIADDIVERLFSEPSELENKPATQRPSKLSRRALLTGTGTS